MTFLHVPGSGECPGIFSPGRRSGRTAWSGSAPGTPPKRAPKQAKSLAALAAARDDLGERQRIVEEMLAGTEADGIQLTTVLDEDYPVNLRTIYNLPPFLFYRGTLRPDDALLRRGRRDTAGERGWPGPGRPDGAPAR